MGKQWTAKCEADRLLDSILLSNEDAAADMKPAYIKSLDTKGVFKEYSDNVVNNNIAKKTLTAFELI